MADLDLGPFRLADAFARGAMGEVWRAWHREQRLPVALKVLTGAHARDSRYVRGFQHEVRAVAGLDHAHIVMLLDVGTVDARAAEASGGRLVEGSPWLAMEYASAGTLKDRRVSGWLELRSLLMAILDALAHAHARGIVHRDLKPANLLFCGERDPRPGLKLTDFGIAARKSDTDSPIDPSAGTPAYMSPEQLLGDQHDLGPWTDLYALGCLAWRLCTQRLPFHGMKRVQLIRAHLTLEPPAFEPSFSVPDAFEGWLRALLAKRPDDRPQRAADAAAALVDLLEDDGADDITEDMDRTEEVTGSWRVPLEPDSATTLGTLFTGERTTEAMHIVEAHPRIGRAIGPPGRMPSWRQHSPARPPVLVGAGLGLFGLREAPLVGRERQQDALWEVLREVHAERTPRGVLVTGAAGSGKTRLQTWLRRRADELGVARVLGVDHRAADADPLAGLLVQLFRTEGLSGEPLEGHLEGLLADREEAATVAAVLRGEVPAEARRGVVTRMVVRAAAERPVLLAVDDAHLDGEVLQLARELLEGDAAVLVVLVVQDEALAERPAEASMLEALPGRRVRVGPLDAVARKELVGALLGLDEQLATRVEARTAGNPLFATQLIGDWVERGWLVLGERGFTLRPDVRLELPDDLHHVWVQRVEQVLVDLAPAASRDLEVAAALGPEVDEWTWHTACDAPDGDRLGWQRQGLKRRNAIVERLLRARLAVEVERGWAFAHGMFRESVMRLSRERGRWTEVCRVSAHALRQREEPGGARAERIGRLLLEAGQPREAIRPLLEGVVQTQRTSVRQALALLVLAEEAADAAGLSPSDPLSGRLLVVRARIHRNLDEYDEALRWARWAQEAARTYHPDPADPGAIRDGERWTVHYRSALDVELSIHLLRRDLRQGHKIFRRLAPLVRATGNPSLLGDLLNAQAGLFQGEHDRVQEADQLLLEAIECYKASGSPRPDAVAGAAINRALLAKDSGQLRRAQALLEAARGDLGPGAGRHLVGVALAIRSEVELRLGEVARAEDTARRSIAVLESLGRGAAEPRVTLGLSLSLRGRDEQALGELTRALRACHDHRRDDLLVTAALASALVEARLARWSSVHDRLREAERASERVPADGHARSIARQLSDVAGHGGFPQLAARARSLASA